MCSRRSAGRLTILFAINPAPLRRRLIVDNDTGCGSNSLAFFVASMAVLRIPRFMSTLSNSTVSLDTFSGRPPLLIGMFSLSIERILLADVGDIPRHSAVFRVERPSDISLMASLALVRVSGFMFCILKGNFNSLVLAVVERGKKGGRKNDGRLQKYPA